jgi:hypothetical protein
VALLIGQFEGLTEQDFDVYQPQCWANNMHNLARMRTKERVLAIAKQVQAHVDDAGLVLEASSEIPSVWNGRKVEDQWAYLLRDTAARKTLEPVFRRDLSLTARVRDPAEHHRHVLLAVRLNHEVLEIGLRINEHATVDLANLLGRGRADRPGLEAALADLPGTFTLGDDTPITADAVLMAAHAARKGQAEWVRIGLCIPQVQAIETGAALAEQISDVAGALLPLMRFLAWTPTNDHVGASEVISEFKNELAEHQAENDERAQKAAEARDARTVTARARTSAKLAAEDAWRKLQRSAGGGEAASDAMEADRKAAREARAEARKANAAERAARRKPARPQGPGLTLAAEGAKLGPIRPDAPQPVAAPPAVEGDAAIAEAPKAAAPKAEAPTADAKADAPKADAPKADAPKATQPERAPRPARKPAGKRPDRPRMPRRPGQSNKPSVEIDLGKPVQAPPPKKPVSELVVGDHVRLTRGLLAGKEGEIRALAVKGYFKVKLGALEMPISEQDLESMQ